MLIIDCCCGLKGASQAMAERGWQVITIDISPRFKPDYLMDIREFNWHGPQPDLIWCSPPCTEFSRDLLPWFREKKIPDLSIMQACRRIIHDAKPRYWIIENVRGAIKWFEPILGLPKYSCKPYFLWGYFPDINHVKLNHKNTDIIRSPANRSKIPYKLSAALAIAIEKAIPLF